MSDRGQGNSPLHWALMGRNQVTTQLKILSRKTFYCIALILNLIIERNQQFYENNFVNFYIDQIVRVQVCIVKSNHFHSECRFAVGQVEEVDCQFSHSKFKRRNTPGRLPQSGKVLGLITLILVSTFR